MPYAVTHMLVPMIIIDSLRHKIWKIKKDKMLANRHILLVGLAGLLPDIDIPLSFLFPSFIVHRGITHTLWVPIIFLLFFSLFHFFRKNNVSKIFLMLYFGTAMHVILDFVTAGSIKLFIL